ncbi:MAG: efflux RND transporter periplasmic adaptor subunit [Methylococcales bacterium]|nr:efflux RND transporter periplasmic adaptor subunit [Methylococcales bacterium]MDP3839150.1 efflux RND transporter periplasmic adaptor subunit [Methylococcales bacterium]
MRTSLQKSKYFLTFLLALSVLCLSSCSKKAEDQPKATAARPIKLMTIGDSGNSSSGNAQTRKLPGTVKAADQVDLAFQVAGTLIDLPVKEGQRVKKGDLVARLDTRDFISNLNNAKGVVAKANASVEYATAEYQRYRNIKATDAGAVSDSIVSLKQTSLKVSKADLQSAQAGLAIAQDQLDYTSLRAPFSGIVARKYVDNFQELKAKEAVVSIQNISDVDITIDVPEMMMTPIRQTRPKVFAEFAADASRRFELKLKEAALQSDSQTQTYRVVFSMPAPSGIRILSGMTATVSIEFAEVNSVVESESSAVIPLIAVLADNAGHSTVWVVDEKTMTVHRRDVTTGELSGADSVRIRSGLKEGEIIAVSGVSKLQENQFVRKFD